MVWDDLKPSDILTRKAFENAIVAASALGASTNCPPHVNAIARHIGVKLSIEDWEKVGYDVPLFLDEDYAKTTPYGGRRDARVRERLALRVVDAFPARANGGEQPLKLGGTRFPRVAAHRSSVMPSRNTMLLGSMNTRTWPSSTSSPP